MRGFAFMKSLPPGQDGRSREERERKLIEAVKQGLMLPIEWRPVRVSWQGHQATLFVASDTLRFGEPGPNANPADWDWVRVAATAQTSQQIADLLGLLLPTDRILDLCHKQADVTLKPHTQYPVLATTAAMLRHHAEIEAERKGRDGLLSTVGKDWILHMNLFPAQRPRHALGKIGAVNYGWHTAGPALKNGPFQGRDGCVLWQTCGSRHDNVHVDYSQWVSRLVHPGMILDGAEISTAEVMTSAELAGLVSYDGPLPEAHYPAVPRLDPIVNPGPAPVEPCPKTEDPSLIA